jgi:putative flavoprotein involved in K+ transport
LQSDIAPPPLENDPADISDPYAECASPLRRLNLREVNVTAVIWTTGFRSDFSWIHLPVLSAGGWPIYKRGISPVRGLYFIGFPWLNSRKSGIIYGIDEDAHYIADAISEQLA